MGYPYEISKCEDKKKYIIKSCESACSFFQDIGLLLPKQYLHYQGWQNEWKGLKCKKFHEFKVKCDFLTAVISHTVRRETLERSALKGQLFLNAHLCEVGLGELALVLRVQLVDDGRVGAVDLLGFGLAQGLDGGDVGRDLDVLEHVGVVQRVVVDDVQLLERLADVQTVVDHFVGDDQPFRGEELRPVLQLVDLELPPESFVGLGPAVGAEARGRVDAHVVPDVLEFVLVGPDVAETARDDRAGFAVVVEHIVAHLQRFQEHQSQNHADVSVQFVKIFFRFFVHVVKLLASLGENYDHFVVNIEQLPCLSAWLNSIVIIVQYFIFKVIDFKFIAYPMVGFVNFELIQYDQSTQLFFIHELCFFINGQSFTLY